MKDRERQCEYYEYEGKCSKGFRGTFKDSCQICKYYRAKKGALPRRKDLRREKENKWRREEDY